jgi:hypothetical protein
MGGQSTSVASIASRRAELAGQQKSQPKMTGQLEEGASGQAGAAAGGVAAAQRWVGRAR